jgi:two-component system sensor histidine kinase DegS
MRDENISLLTKALNHLYLLKESTESNYSNSQLYKIEQAIHNLNQVISSEHDSRNSSDTHREALTILQIQEDERRRVAMELHDVSLQNLAYLFHKIELGVRYIDMDAEKAKQELNTVGKSLRSIINEMRGIIFNLRPVDLGDDGLRSDLEHLAYKLNEQNLFFVSTDIDEIDFHNNITQVSVYRIVKECLTNAFTHSKGNQLFFSMKKADNSCVITIKDNGVGFDFEKIKNKLKNHFGLSVLQERVRLLDGILNIESKVGSGTTITIYIPYNDKYEERGGSKNEHKSNDG